MELRHLRYFNEIANGLSFSRAAQTLHVAQPALSARIRDLEQELGVALFRRLGSRIELTGPGEIFHGHVRQLLESLDHAVRLTRRADRVGPVSLTIGFIGSASYSFLPWVLRAFRALRPEVDLSLAEFSSPRQMENLLRGTQDVGFLRLPVNDPAIAVEIIHRERFIVALPATHRLARRQRLAASDLADEAFVMFPPGERAGFHHQVVMICQRAGFAPRIAQYAAPMQNVIGLVGAGLGISIVPASVAKIVMPEVCYRPFADPEFLAETAVAWNRNVDSPTREAFLEVVRSVAAEVAAGG